MEKRKYDITMRTPMGIKYGTMIVILEERTLNGVMNLLDHVEPFYGSIEKNGNCQIQGNLITLMRTIAYTAVGKMSPESVQLIMQEERNVFEVYGNRMEENEERN